MVGLGWNPERTASAAAYGSLAGPRRSEMKKTVLREIARWAAAGLGGLTSEETETQLGMKHQSVSALISMLKKAGLLTPAWVYDINHSPRWLRRQTVSRRWATVWALTPMATSYLA